MAKMKINNQSRLTGCLWKGEGRQVRRRWRKTHHHQAASKTT